MKKFYVASKWENKERVREVIGELTNIGHQNTYDWTKSQSDSYLEGLKDIRGVRDCDFLVGIFENVANYQGALVEFGVALADQKEIFVLGDILDNMIFMKFPNVTKVKSLGELLILLGN